LKAVMSKAILHKSQKILTKVSDLSYKMPIAAGNKAL
jgi:hypothetical protein